MLVVIDYGMGNLRSVQKAFERLNVSAKISSDPSTILGASKIVIPGVGHFSKGIKNLKSSGLYDCLNEAILVRKTPIMGICLGMQLMTEWSEEGDVQGFGWINALTRKFQPLGNTLKIPHMGWNNLQIISNNLVLHGINSNDFFYFVHSFYIECKNENDIVAKTNYGNTFVSMFNKGNIYGCQFHPEKSHDCGMVILKNFVEL